MTGLVPELLDEDEFTPELMDGLRKAGTAVLVEDEKVRFTHTRIIATAAGLRF